MFGEQEGTPGLHALSEGWLRARTEGETLIGEPFEGERYAQRWGEC